MAIEEFVPGLPLIPGWTALGPAKQGWLMERTNNIGRYRQRQAQGVLGEMRELYLIREGLTGTAMSMGNYLSTMYPRSERTGWKRLSDYEALLKIMPQKAIDALADDHMGPMAGTGGVAAGDVIRAAKALPPPKSDEPRIIEGYLTELRTELKKERQARRKGHRRGLGPDEAMKQFVVTGRRLIRDTGFRTPAERRAWLRMAIGYLMEVGKIEGTVTIERTPIPDGWLPKRGRPRGALKTRRVG